MLSTLRNAWKIPELRKKIIFTLVMLFVIRLGSAIPVPYMDKAEIAKIFERSQGGILSFLDLMSGGNISDISIFATNIYPFITASIVIQLLTIAIPSLEEIAKEGEEGSKKIARYTKYMGIVLAFIQAAGYTLGFFKDALRTTNAIQTSIVILSLVAGTSFLIWIGDMITEKGIGNGTSLIIFIGIVSRLPQSILTIFALIKAGAFNPLGAIVLLLIALFIVAMVVALQEGERRVPVQYAKRVVGRKMYGGQNTHIPIKVSMSGVMPVIFASSLLAFPQTIAAFSSGSVAEFITKYFTPYGTTVGLWVYSILNVLLIMFFTYFYTAVQFNTVEYAQNLQQNGGFVPGIRPGRPTSEYLNKIVSRITFVGGLSLALLASLPTLLSALFGMNINFGGTAVIIVVGVVLETIKQLEAQMLMRHYKGFLN